MEVFYAPPRQDPCARRPYVGHARTSRWTFTVLDVEDDPLRIDVEIKLIRPEPEIRSWW